MSSDCGDVNRSDLVADRSAMPQQFGDESNANLRVTPVAEESFDFAELFESDNCSPKVENKEESTRIGLLAALLACDKHLASHACGVVAVASAQLKVASKLKLDGVCAGTKASTPSTSCAKIHADAIIKDILANIGEVLHIVPRE